LKAALEKVQHLALALRQLDTETRELARVASALVRANLFEYPRDELSRERGLTA
jgi:hypothetical protein